jgi:hypothetical protein
LLPWPVVYGWKKCMIKSFSDTLIVERSDHRLFEEAFAWRNCRKP